jgi:hypothetical protein
MTIVLKLVDSDGAPLELSDDVRVVLLDEGDPIATGVRRADGSFGFEDEAAREGLAVRLEPGSGGEAMRRRRTG